MKLRTTILLSQKEKIALTKIQAYAATLNKVVPRVAGGWVRDKLLGIDSNDIDITLDTVSGYEFASGMRSFYGWNGPVGKIKANPDKSKHLETAVMKINGISIDFLSLRKEEYGETRIPQIISCSAKEDAFRRDLTINSLFYNLMTEKIEDLTEFGLEDLKNQIIRTPLPPYQTLIDDPLRILRIIRFSIKFNFQISNELLVTFKDENIKISLYNKISAERIRTEIIKILECERFVTAFKIFTSHDLLYPIFKKKFAIDMTKLMRVYNNYTNLRKYMIIDDQIVRLYVLLVFNSAEPKNNSFSNYLMVKNSLCCNKNIFSKVKQIERNLVLLKQISEKMTDEDVVFLLRHMREEYETSIAIYLMVGEFDRIEISDFFKNNRVECFNTLIQQNHDDLKDKMLEKPETHEIKVEEAVKRNKYLVLYLITCAQRYRNALFPNNFLFNGKMISEWLNIEQHETSFYLEMAKVQTITNKISLENMPKKLCKIQEDKRIEGFKFFYLTDKF